MDNKDGIDIAQLHAGPFNSDDGGETWWCGRFFSDTPKQELIDMAVGIIRDVPTGEGVNDG